MITLIVNIGGSILICGIIWWFWYSEPKAKIAKNEVIEILVDGGVYEPAIISAKVGRPIEMQFLRKDASPCAEKVIFNQLGLNLDLDVNQPKKIEIIPNEVGDIEFTCQMGMYKGSIHVTK